MFSKEAIQNTIHMLIYQYEIEQDDEVKQVLNHLIEQLEVELEDSESLSYRELELGD